VKQFLLLSTLVAVLFACGASEVAAQQRPPAAPPAVAIVDLGYLFKTNERFKQLTEAMRREVQGAEGEIKGEAETLRKMAEHLDDFRPGSPEKAQLEEDLTKKDADMKLRMNLQKKKFMEQEAKIYYVVYKEILDHVKYHCDRVGITLVMRFNGDPIVQSDPQEVIRELNKSVIYYNPAVDITPIIQESIANAQRGGAQQAPPTTMRPPVTPGASGVPSNNFPKR
jgi:Skp family chaperone for outer membrane proteins